MTRNMTTYANIKLAEIFALYRNPFTRGSCKKNFKQKLIFNYNKRIDFQENVKENKIPFVNMKGHFNGTIFPFKMNLVDNFNNNNDNKIITIKKLNDEYIRRNSSNTPNYDNNSNGNNLIDNQFNKEKPKKNILSVIDLVKIENLHDKQLKGKNNTSQSVILGEKIKKRIFNERKEATMVMKNKFGESITPTKEQYDSNCIINMNSTDFIDLMTLNKKDKNE